MNYCTDTDLLHFEPNLFHDAAFASQTLIAGTGDLVGTTFAIDAGSLTGAHVQSQHVIVLSGGTSGCYPIVDVDSATQLTISVLYDALFPVGGSPAPSPVGTINDLGFAIRTFSPQARVVSAMLDRAAGVDGSSAATLIDAEPLRRPCALGTIELVYSALAGISNADDAPRFAARADVYAKLFRRAIEGTLVEIDLDGDGRADLSRQLAVTQFVRR